MMYSTFNTKGVRHFPKRGQALWGDKMGNTAFYLVYRGVGVRPLRALGSGPSVQDKKIGEKIWVLQTEKYFIRTF